MHSKILQAIKLKTPRASISLTVSRWNGSKN